MERFKLHIEAESRIRWKVYVRFGGEFSETDHSNMARRWLLSLLLCFELLYDLYHFFTLIIIRRYENTFLIWLLWTTGIRFTIENAARF